MNIKKTLLSLMIGFVMIVNLCACEDTNMNAEEPIGTENSMNTMGQLKDEITVGEKNDDMQSQVEPTTTTVPMWKDNTQDIYTGVVRNVFEEQSPENLIGGGSYPIGSNGRGVWFKKYFFEEFENNKEYLCFSEADGTFCDIELLPEEYGLSGSVLMAGTSANSNEYALYVSTRKDGVFIDSMTVIDSEGKCIRSLQPEVSFDFHTYAPTQMMMDKEGNIYCLSSDSNGNVCYYVLDVEGKSLVENFNTEYTNIRFVGLANGEVALLIHNEEGIYQLLGLDLVTGEELVLVDMADFSEVKTHEQRVLFVTSQDEENIYYITGEGIYHYQRGAEAELLYLFRNHGVRPSEILHMHVSDNGEIGILYATGNVTEFMLLTPTAEQREIIEIPFAMAETNRMKFDEAIVAFNKKYPQYLITISEYEDETQLLTELTVGKGPVLVDTNYLDFEENVKLWECLDEEIGTIGLQEAMLDKLLDAGRIDGKQYGVVTQWTMLTFASTINMTDWNQEQFVEYVNKHPEIRSIYRDQAPMLFMDTFFFQGMDESSFWNIDTDEVFFETEYFKQVLKMAEHLAFEMPRGSSSENIEKVRSGERLGELVYINGAELLSYYNETLGEEMKYIGFPGREGSKHYIRPAAPITIRSTATEEQKQAAVLFLEHLLSYETQKEMSELALSVRKDVFEEYLNDLEEESIWTIDGEEFKFLVDKENVREQFLEIYENAVCMPRLPIEVENILEEELQNYFVGEKTIEQVCYILQNRMQLYLDEH